MKSQIIDLQAQNKNMNEINTLVTKTNHYQELIKTMKKEKGIKQILLTDNTAMKMEIQKLRANKKKAVKKLKD